MNTLGIIAEYNPFHKGHSYALEKLKKKVNADYVVVIMSGDYTQRGCPAVFDKYTRTRMALSCGADLVLELPIYYSTGSAEYFAGGAVSILNALECIDYLGFGSESDDIDSLSRIATILANESDDLSALIKEKIKAGMNYAAARALSLSELNSIDTGIISASNDILGTEYIKALRIQSSSIKPVCIKRTGAGYHDAASTDSTEYASAEAIRGIIYNNTIASQETGIIHNSIIASQETDSIHNSIIASQESDSIPDDMAKAINAIKIPSNKEMYKSALHHGIDSISDLIPAECIAVLKDSLSNGSLSAVTADDFSHLLFYRLLAERSSGYSRYVDVTESLSDKIRSVLYSFESFEDFISLLKTKDITYTHISRALLHILLGLTDEHLAEYTADRSAFISYARILGLRKSASPLLKKIQECSRIPVISRLSDSEKALNETQLRLLNETLTSSDIYNLIYSNAHPVSEYKRTIITLP